MSKSLIKPGSASLRFWQLLLLVVILGVWHLASRDPKVAFFFGEPLKVWGRIWAWFVTNADIYTHLWVTLTETVLAFFIGTAAGLGRAVAGARRWPARSWIPTSRRPTRCRE